MAEHINKVKPGEMKEVEVREACRVLDALAHSMHKNDLEPKECDKRGEVSWLLLKRLMTEDNLFDPVNDVLLPIHGYPVIVDHALCHNAIKCMAQSNQRHLFDKALLILKTLEEHFVESQSKKLRPVGRSYALLLDAARNRSHVGDDEVVSFVESLMTNASRQEAWGNNLVTMNRHIFNAALNTLCSRAETSPGAAEVIERLISQDDAPLDQASFSISLKAILSSKGLQESTADILASVEPLLLRMEAYNYLPSQMTMTPLLDHLSKRGDLNEIIRILNWMEDMYQRRGWEDIRPNRIHFNTLINAMSKSKNGGKKAMELLNKMKIMHANGSNESARPDLVTYNAVLNAIAKETTSSGSKRSQIDSDIGERAESLLFRMEDGAEGDHIVPDIVSYNTVLSAHMNSHAIDAAEKVQAILHRMSDRDIEPDLLSYTACINTLAKSKMQGSAQKAEDLLRKLEEAYAAGNENLKPDIKCYNSGEFYAYFLME
jgi:pentatricopeptide repeat protein